MADFGGPTRTRATAYLTATVIGAAFVALATPVSDNPWAGALLMVVVGAVVAFSGVLGGYAAAGSSAVTLAFVLAVTVPAEVGDIPDRLAGWVLGGLSATIAAVVLWPSHASGAVRRKADVLVAATVDVLEHLADPATTSDASRDRMHDALDALDDTVRTMPHRPLGPTAREQALAYLIDELRVLTHAIDDVIEASPGSLTPTDHEMLRAVIDLLDSATSHAPPDLVGFEQRFESHRDRTGKVLVEAIGRGVAGDELAAVLDRTFRVRTVGTAAMSVGANVMLVERHARSGHHDMDQPAGRPPMELRGSIRRGARSCDRAGATGLGVVPQRSSRRRRPRYRRADRGRRVADARLLGRTGHAVGVEVERGGHPPHRRAGVSRDVRRLRRGQLAVGGDR